MQPSRATKLEELLAHQQRMLDDLNQVVTELRSEVDRLTLEHGRTRLTLTRLVELHEGAEEAPDEKPPHY
ncbi:MAG: SlyX family protein [Planctomycetota bacterium]